MPKSEHSKALILYIEDDANLAEMYKYKFEREGYEVRIAQSGREGLELAEQEKPDLILLDIIMTEMDGLEVLKILKTEEKTKKIPVLILTNLDRLSFAQQAKDLGALDFFVKAQMTPTQILQKVKEVLK